MFNFKHIITKKISFVAIVILVAFSCAKDQNSFLPSVRVNIPISLINFNFLTVPGNSIVFENQGVKRGYCCLC